MNKNFLHRLLFSIFFAPLVILIVYLGGFYFKCLILLIFIIALYEILLLKNLKIKFIIFFILAIFIFSLFKIASLRNGTIYIFFILVVAWLSDTGGYVFGKLIGGKKIKFISHNKTYSGFLGSLILAQFSIFYLDYFDIYFYNLLYLNMFLVICLSVLVIFGDLLFSWFKRTCNIKDYSNLLPGHGGILDRIDGLIILTIFFNFFLAIK
jgi:phosphatidate cytidylyltransferase